MLLVLQGLDTSGKGGTVRHVVGPCDPAGVHAASFGRPTPEELRHDFLWRIRQQLPRAGKLGVFDRSHYEDVLAVRVRKLADKRTWTRRYDAINRFEAELAEGGTRIVKCYLHISREEQRARLLARLGDPTKHWKYNPHDLEDRALWDDYMAAYADALERCSTEAAPWHIIPADRKWYRNWAITQLLCEELEGLGPGVAARPTSTSRKSCGESARFPRVRADGSGCRGGPGARVPGREAADDARRLSAQPQRAARGVQPVDQPRPRRPVRRGDDPRRAAPARAAALGALRQRRAGREVPPPARREPGLEHPRSRRCSRC